MQDFPFCIICINKVHKCTFVCILYTINTKFTYSNQSIQTFKWLLLVTSGFLKVNKKSIIIINFNYNNDVTRSMPFVHFLKVA